MGQKVRSSTSNDVVDVRGMEERLRRTQSELADVRNRLSQLNQEFKRRTDEYSKMDANLKNIEKTELKVGSDLVLDIENSEYSIIIIISRRSNRESHR